MTFLTTLSIQNEIAIITLNHVKKNNILSTSLRNELLAHYDQCENDHSIKIIILNANGKHFCAGADLNEMHAMANAPFNENLQDAKKLAYFFYRLYNCKKPTICCAHGKIMGGGLGLIAVNDITIATRTAEFCFPEVKLAMLPSTIAPFILHRIGFASAQSLMLTADFFNAERAYEIKLIDHLYDEDPIDLAFLLAEKMLKNNSTGMQTTKKWLRELYPITPKQLDRAAQLLAEIRNTAEAKEALLKQTLRK